eukprot:m.80148 g.80148  ORF g.80148 m.80148 type:complete len:358 (-) comp19355_c0_seq1:198-1271(-)
MLGGSTGYQDGTASRAGRLRWAHAVMCALACSHLRTAAADEIPAEMGFNGLTEVVSGRLVLPNSLAQWPPKPEYVMLSRELLTDSICRKTPEAVQEICAGRTAAPGLSSELPLCKPAVRKLLCLRGQNLGRGIQDSSAREVAEARQACTAVGRSPCEFHSVQHEDAVVFNTFFKDKEGGVFIESGASQAADNTIFLEHTMKWSGVLIEASPTNYKALQRNRGGGRAKLINSAVCSKERTLKYVDQGDVSGSLDSLTDAAIKSWGLDRNPPIEVPCLRMEKILRDAGIKRVDLWVLDVEGAELDVLQSHDFKANPVHVLVIERNVHDFTIEVFLLERGFKYWREQRGNRIFVNEGFDG